ncbi:MAG: hypothetical protein V3V78_02120 [Candidatus Woesearchaeota archaeon]
MDDVKLVQLNNGGRLQILERLGYSIDEEGFIITTKTKKEVVCKYSEEKVHINTAAVLPGSNIIINANPFTMAQYFADHVNDG